MGCSTWNIAGVTLGVVVLTRRRSLRSALRQSADSVTGASDQITKRLSTPSPALTVVAVALSVLAVVAVIALGALVVRN